MRELYPRQQFPSVTERGRVKTVDLITLARRTIVREHSKKTRRPIVDRSLRLSSEFNFTHDMHATLDVTNAFLYNYISILEYHI